MNGNKQIYSNVQRISGVSNDNNIAYNNNVANTPHHHTKKAPLVYFNFTTPIVNTHGDSYRDRNVSTSNKDAKNASNNEKNVDKPNQMNILNKTSMNNLVKNTTVIIPTSIPPPTKD